jgi:hypothetical protein
MAQPIRFNPEQVAYYEKAGWQAYYERRWLRVLSLMVGLNRAEFQMPLPAAIAAAWETMRAAVAFAPLDNDLVKTQHYLARFYARAGRFVHLAADADTLAALELEYWVVHRRLAIQRQQNPTQEDLEPMVESLARLHAALFGSTPAAQRTSAEWRARAAAAVDRITGKRSTDVAADWQEVEECLQKAYRAVQTQQHVGK